MEWKPIKTAPRDGSVFIGRNANHPEWGSWPMLRHISWEIDPNTGKPESHDLGAWLKVCDHDASFGTGFRTPSIPFATAADEYNKNVTYEWQPLP